MRLSQWLSVLALTLSLFNTAAHADYPTRGMSMVAVKTYYGEPNYIRHSAPPVKKQWPKITVWEYNGFAVYFERNTVLHIVTH